MHWPNMASAIDPHFLFFEVLTKNPRVVVSKHKAACGAAGIATHGTPSGKPLASKTNCVVNGHCFFKVHTVLAPFGWVYKVPCVSQSVDVVATVPKSREEALQRFGGIERIESTIH